MQKNQFTDAQIVAVLLFNSCSRPKRATVRTIRSNGPLANCPDAFKPLLTNRDTFAIGHLGSFSSSPENSAEPENSADNCAAVGKLDMNSSGSRSVIWYSDTPIGALLPRSAYSTDRAFFYLQRMRPMLGASSGWRRRSSTTFR